MRESIADASLAGRRLDQAVAELSGLGLRGARRLISEGAITLNGKKSLKSARLRQGDVICQTESPYSGPGARLIGRQGDYCFFFKPGGLHTAALAGGGKPSLEAQLPYLCEANNLAVPSLLQRLDHGTSGLVCAAFGNDAARAWRNWQKEGKCRKFYFALLSGSLARPLLVRNAIIAGAKKSRLAASEADPLRWTSIEPLWQGDLAGYGAVTLARCAIKSGQRHQIRVHAAGCGHPLAGDSLYGASGDRGYKLAHYRLDFPGHSMTCRDEELAGMFPWLACEMENSGCIS